MRSLDIISQVYLFVYLFYKDKEQNLEDKKDYKFFQRIFSKKFILNLWQRSKNYL